MRDVVGTYRPNDGEGLTVEELIEMLRTIPAKARRSSYVSLSGGFDIIGMSIGQSDQAEDYELKVYLDHSPMD